MKILVLGGSGFVGRHLIPAVLAAGHQIALLNRGNRPMSGTVQIVADRRDPQAMHQAAAANGDFDAVIDTSAYRRQDSVTAVEAFGGRTRHWIHLSSAAVYLDTLAHPPDESARLGGAPVWGDYGREKSECDVFLLGEPHPFRVTVLRPPYLYGPGNDSDRETFVWSRALRSEPVLVPGDGTTQVQFLHCADLAAAFVACLNREGPAIAAYNVGNRTTMSLADWVRDVAASADLADPARLVGDRDLGHAPRSYFPFRDYSCWVDPARIMAELGWQPQVAFADGLRATFASYSAPTLAAQSPISQAESAILAAMDAPPIQAARGVSLC